MSYTVSFSKQCIISIKYKFVIKYKIIFSNKIHNNSIIQLRLRCLMISMNLYLQSDIHVYSK